jgi:hypothetical protein
MEEFASKIDEYEVAINDLQSCIETKDYLLKEKSIENEELKMIQNELQSQIEELNTYMAKVTDDMNYEIQTKEKYYENIIQEKKRKHIEKIEYLEKAIRIRDEKEKTLEEMINKLKKEKSDLELSQKDFLVDKVDRKEIESRDKKIQSLINEKENFSNMLSESEQKISNLELNYKDKEKILEK